MIVPIVGTCDPALEELAEKLAASIRSGAFARGVTLEIRLGADIPLSCGIGADGLHEQIDAGTLFAVYCCTKPLVALAIASLVAEGEVSWDDCLGDIVDAAAPEGIRRCTIEQMLTHTAGLHRLRAEDVLPCSPSDRKHMIGSHTPPEGWSPESHLAYSNFLGWHWLISIIRSVTGRLPAAYIRSSVIEPLGLAGQIFLGFDASEAEIASERCGVNVDLTGNFPVPLLLERVPSFMSDPDLVAAGGYATMTGLCRFYQSLLEILTDGSDVDGWLSPSLVSAMTMPHVQARHDLIMDRTGSWGLGFMVDLQTHKFGSLVSRRSFGHSGNAGSSFAFCDPTYELCVSVLYTAKVDSHVSVSARRSSLVDSIYSALGLGGGS